MEKEKTDTFIVKVMKKQNDSWQGSVTLAANNETLYFRSAMELIHMMEEVLNRESI